MEILETFPQVFCFQKSRINENGGKCISRYIILYSDLKPVGKTFKVVWLIIWLDFFYQTVLILAQ